MTTQGGSVQFRRELVIGTALLVAVVTAAYGKVIFFGETLVSTANYSPIDDRFTHLRPGSVSGPAFLNWHDQGEYDAIFDANRRAYEEKWKVQWTRHEHRPLTFGPARDAGSDPATSPGRPVARH